MTDQQIKVFAIRDSRDIVDEALPDASKSERAALMAVLLDHRLRELERPAERASEMMDKAMDGAKSVLEHLASR